jgi:hypothetical protein
VPNEIVIETMIKGLRPGPTAQYFARKPPQTLEKLLQKMDEYIFPLRVTTKEVSLRGHNTPHNLRGNSRALLDHQLQGAEAPGASREDLGISLERSTAYSVRTRAILQECAKSPFRSKRR